MNDMLHKYLNVFIVVYLDDILIYLKLKEEHVKHVRLVLKKLKKNNLLLKLEKCDFYKEEVKFLRHLVRVNGVYIDLKKTNVVMD
jgi:hypothetical protein